MSRQTYFVKLEQPQHNQPGGSAAPKLFSVYYALAESGRALGPAAKMWIRNLTVKIDLPVPFVLDIVVMKNGAPALEQPLWSRSETIKDTSSVLLKQIPSTRGDSGYFTADVSGISQFIQGPSVGSDVALQDVVLGVVFDLDVAAIDAFISPKSWFGNMHVTFVADQASEDARVARQVAAKAAVPAAVKSAPKSAAGKLTRKVHVKESVRVDDDDVPAPKRSSRRIPVGTQHKVAYRGVTSL